MAAVHLWVALSHAYISVTIIRSFKTEVKGIGKLIIQLGGRLQNFNGVESAPSIKVLEKAVRSR